MLTLIGYRPNVDLLEVTNVVNQTRIYPTDLSAGIFAFVSLHDVRMGEDDSRDTWYLWILRDNGDFDAIRRIAGKQGATIRFFTGKHPRYWRVSTIFAPNDTLLLSQSDFWGDNYTISMSLLGFRGSKTLYVLIVSGNTVIMHMAYEDVPIYENILVPKGFDWEKLNVKHEDVQSRLEKMIVELSIGEVKLGRGPIVPVNPAEELERNINACLIAAQWLNACKAALRDSKSNDFVLYQQHAFAQGALGYIDIAVKELEELEVRVRRSAYWKGVENDAQQTKEEVMLRLEELGDDAIFSGVVE